MTTETLRASEMGELVVRILEMREPGTLKAYTAELAKYERARKRAGSPPEVKVRVTNGMFVTDGQGFYVLKDGEPKGTARPERPTPLAYRYSGYDRFGSYTHHARGLGLLVDSRYNRDIRPDRVNEYAEAMEAGEWRDLFSDPITITSEGQVLNGQHRIAAAQRVDWNTVSNDPMFLVVFNVEPSEALYADGSRRTDHDERVIATKLALS